MGNHLEFRMKLIDEDIREFDDDEYLIAKNIGGRSFRSDFQIMTKDLEICIKCEFFYKMKDDELCVGCAMG